MRLEKILKEAAEFQIAVKDIESKMHELYRVLKKNNFQMSDLSLEKSLDAIFKDKRIGFTPGKKRGPHFSHVIDSGGITEDMFIIIEYVPGFSKYFRRFAKDKTYENFFSIAKNEFFRSLAEVVSHEYKHFFQALKSGLKSLKKGISTIPNEVGFKSYFISPEELDAFALQAAVQIVRLGKSNIVAQYEYYFSEENPKIWKKFLKKTDSHVQDLKKRGLEKYIRLN